VAAQFSSLAPAYELGRAIRFPASHLQHVVHSRNHEAVLKEPEFHVLAPDDCSGIVGLAIEADLFLDLRVEVQEDGGVAEEP
jgi:hypothetical protein